MARRGKDLFELLQLRARGDAPAPRRRQPSPTAESVGAMWRWVADLVPKKPKRARGKPAKRSLSRGSIGRGATSRGPAGGPGVSMSGLLLAAALLGCLAAGFGLGRVTSGASDGPALRKPEQAERPRVFPPAEDLAGAAACGTICFPR